MLAKPRSSASRMASLNSRRDQMRRSGTKLSAYCSIKASVYLLGALWASKCSGIGMNKLILVSFMAASAMFAQSTSQSSQSDSSSTTVIQDHGNKTATESSNSSSSTDANGVTRSNSSQTATKTKKKHGKVVSKSA